MIKFTESKEFRIVDFVRLEGFSYNYLCRENLETPELQKFFKEKGVQKEEIKAVLILCETKKNQNWESLAELWFSEKRKDCVLVFFPGRKNENELEGFSQRFAEKFDDQIVTLAEYEISEKVIEYKSLKTKLELVGYSKDKYGKDATPIIVEKLIEEMREDRTSIFVPKFLS